jgi:hypothetical protein
MPESLEDRVAALEAVVAKLHGEVDMLLAAREAFNKGMKEGDVAELRDEIRAGFANILRKLESR